MKKILISRDEAHLTEHLENIQAAKPVFENLWNSFQKEMFYSKDTTLNDLVLNRENLLTAYKQQKLSGRIPTIEGLAVNETQALLLYAVPVTPDFEKYHAEAQQYVQQLKYFQVKGNAVIQDKKAMEALESRFTVYAETNLELELYEKYNNLLKGIEEMDRFLAKNTKMRLLLHGKPLLLSQYFKQDHDRIEMNVRFFKSLMGEIKVGR